MPNSTSYKFNFQHLRNFIAVAEELHFHRAAERLNMAQPALSRSIQHLETYLGFSLFVRTNRSVKLSSSGEAFLQGAVTTLETVDKAVRHARAYSQGKSGRLRIGYTDFAINGGLPALLRAFTQEYPDITIEPIHGVTTKQMADLAQDRLDFGFVTGPISAENIDAIIVQEDSYSVVVYESHRLADRKSIYLSELAQEKFILGTPSEWQYFMDHLLPMCVAAGFTPDMVQHAFNTEGIFGLVACEMGISIHTSVANNFLRKGLKVIPLADEVKKLPTICVWHNANLTPVEAIFIGFLRSDPASGILSADSQMPVPKH